MSEIGLDLLPEDCFAQIMSLTSPQDACRSVVFVSSLARFMVDSDAVWQKFLPSDCEEILSRLVSPFDYSSQKELFARLSKPQLIDGGRKVNCFRFFFFCLYLYNTPHVRRYIRKWTALRVLMVSLYSFSEKII